MVRWIGHILRLASIFISYASDDLSVFNHADCLPFESAQVFDTLFHFILFRFFKISCETKPYQGKVTCEFAKKDPDIKITNVTGCRRECAAASSDTRNWLENLTWITLHSNPATATTSRQAPTPEQRAKDLIAAIDAGGLPLNAAVVNDIARKLGLEVSTRARMESHQRPVRTHSS